MKTKWEMQREEMRWRPNRWHRFKTSTRWRLILLIILALLALIWFNQAGTRAHAQETAELVRDRAAVMAKRNPLQCLRGSKRLCKPKRQK